MQLPCVGALDEIPLIRMLNIKDRRSNVVCFLDESLCCREVHPLCIWGWFSGTIPLEHQYQQSSIDSVIKFHMGALRSTYFQGLRL